MISETTKPIIGRNVTFCDLNKKCKQTLESAQNEMAIVFNFAKFGKKVFRVVLFSRFKRSQFNLIVPKV